MALPAVGTNKLVPIGKTMERTKPVADSKEKEKGGPPRSYSEVPGPDFNVRCGPDYAGNGHKRASGHSLYELVHVDWYRMERKIPHIARLVNIDEIRGTAKETEELGIPSLLIVNCMVPDYAPANPVWGSDVKDGVGYALIYYFKLTESTKNELRKKDPADNSVRLLRSFIQAKPDSPIRKRFKGISRLWNPENEKVNLSGVTKKLVTTYNGKPFMIDKSFDAYEGLGYFEVDADIHRFSYLALTGLAGFKESAAHMVWDLGFVIQGQTDDELPERMIGGAFLSQVAYDKGAEVFPAQAPLVRK